MQENTPATKTVYDDDVVATILVYLKWKKKGEVVHASNETVVTRGEVEQNDGRVREVLEQKARMTMTALAYHHDLVDSWPT